jgi:hypothetical protein
MTNFQPSCLWSVLRRIREDISSSVCGLNCCLRNPWVHLHHQSYSCAPSSLVQHAVDGLQWPVCSTFLSSRLMVLYSYEPIFKHQWATCKAGLCFADGILHGKAADVVPSAVTRIKTVVPSWFAASVYCWLPETPKLISRFFEADRAPSKCEDLSNSCRIWMRKPG